MSGCELLVSGRVFIVQGSQDQCRVHVSSRVHNMLSWRFASERKPKISVIISSFMIAQHKNYSCSFIQWWNLAAGHFFFCWGSDLESDQSDLQNFERLSWQKKMADMERDVFFNFVGGDFERWWKTPTRTGCWQLKYFLFSHRKLGFHDPIWGAYVSNGLVRNHKLETFSFLYFSWLVSRESPAWFAEPVTLEASDLSAEAFALMRVDLQDFRYEVPKMVDLVEIRKSSPN